jgi:hypothetical protein
MSPWDSSTSIRTEAFPPNTREPMCTWSEFWLESVSDGPPEKISFSSLVNGLCASGSLSYGLPARNAWGRKRLEESGRGSAAAESYCTKLKCVSKQLIINEVVVEAMGVELFNPFSLQCSFCPHSLEFTAIRDRTIRA